MDHEGFVNLIAGLGDGDKNTALEVRTLFTHLIQSIYLPGDVKEVDCTKEEIERDYDATGLGVGIRIGWAICNGLNGTQPRGGRTGIGLSDDYPEIGALGGSKTHKLTIPELPSHGHNIKYQNHNASGGGSEKTLDLNTNVTVSSDSTGGDKPHNNMQPYIVSLFIQKL